MRYAILLLALLHLSGCVECSAACNLGLQVTIGGFSPGEVYSVEVATDTETLTCTADTVDGLVFECEAFVAEAAGTDQVTFRIADTPASVAIRVELNGDVVFFRTLTPAYQRGEVCGDSCDFADVDVSF